MAMPEHYGPAVYKIVWREFSIDSVGRTRNKVRTAPLWGVRLRPRLMHDGASLTLRDAILRRATRIASPWCRKIASRSVKDAPSCINRGRRRTPHRGAVRPLFRALKKLASENFFQVI